MYIVVFGVLAVLKLLQATNIAEADGSCKYDFKVYVYPLPESLPSVKIADEARTKKTLHICQKCIFVRNVELIFDVYSQG